jgi:integrase/recombinase XerD
MKSADIIAQNNEKLLSQIAAMLSQQNAISNKGGAEMPRKLKYGKGCITKRLRITYFDENNVRKIVTTSNENKAKILESKYKKCNIYEWYQVEWFDEYGKRHSETAKTQTVALAILDENNKRSMRNSRQHLKTFGEAMHEWYKEFRQENACAERNETNIREINRLPKNIANKPIQTVTAQELQKHLNDIKCDNPRITAKTLLTSFLHFLFLQGTIKKDISQLLKAPLPRRAEKQVLTATMEPKFLSLLPEKFRDYAIGLIYTGCRYSEFISIQAEDVDRVNKTITIRETKSIRANDRRQGRMHNTRVIPLLPIIEDLSFPLPYISQAYFQRAFKKASREMGIKVSPHDMRHTFATRCDDCGIKEKVIQSILGHKTERMTRHYKNHKTAELLENEFAKIRGDAPINTQITCNETLSNKNQPIQILTLENEIKFIEQFPERFRDYVIGFIYTGCRFSELVKIQEEDIDRINKTIFIQETKIGSGATKARTIPLLPSIEKIKFPLPAISKKYFFALFQAASQKLNIGLTIDNIVNVFPTRYNNTNITKSTAISTAIRAEITTK